MVEEIIARVNNEIITLSDYEKAEAQLADESRQDCPGCSPEKLQEMLQTGRANLLRDLIDESLLAQKGKDLGLNVEAEVVKRLDELRQQYGWKDMDDMETQLRAQGISLEDYKNTLRNRLLTQAVIHREVNSRIQVTREEEEKYYQDHLKDFNKPENVVLAEFFLSTENKPESDIPAIEAKAKGYLERIRNGESFEEMAKHFSEGSTAKDGGFLGSFERGQLSKQIEDVVFKMKRGDVSDVIRTKTGFLILTVLQHYDPGIQPLDKVRNEVDSRILFTQSQPELRKYLATLREESYLVIRPGYTDTAAVPGNPIVEVDPAAAPGKSEKDKKSKKHKKEKEAAG